MANSRSASDHGGRFLGSARLRLSLLRRKSSSHSRSRSTSSSHSSKGGREVQATTTLKSKEGPSPGEGDEKGRTSNVMPDKDESGNNDGSRGRVGGTSGEDRPPSLTSARRTRDEMDEALERYEIDGSGNDDDDGVPSLTSARRRRDEMEGEAEAQADAANGNDVDTEDADDAQLEAMILRSVGTSSIGMGMGTSTGVGGGAVVGGVGEVGGSRRSQMGVVGGSSARSGAVEAPTPTTLTSARRTRDEMDDEAEEEAAEANTVDVADADDAQLEALILRSVGNSGTGMGGAIVGSFGGSRTSQVGVGGSSRIPRPEESRSRSRARLSSSSSVARWPSSLTFGTGDDGNDDSGDGNLQASATRRNRRPNISVPAPPASAFRPPEEYRAGEDDSEERNGRNDDEDGGWPSRSGDDREEDDDLDDVDETDADGVWMPPPPSPSDSNPTPRFLLGRTPVPWDEFLSLLRQIATEVDAADDSGRPLRIAGLTGVDDAHGQSLLQRALMETDPPGIPPEAVRLLLELDPTSATDADDDGRTALYYACYYRADVEIVRILLNANPDAAKRRTGHGTLPLHAANRADAARVLLEAFPEAVWIRDFDGELPLHGVATWGDAEAVKVLLDAARRTKYDARHSSLCQGNVPSVAGDLPIDPATACGGALVKDCRGNTPLDRAVQLVVALSERDVPPPAGPPVDLRRSFVFVRPQPVQGGHTGLKPLCGDGVEAWRKFEALAEAAWRCTTSANKKKKEQEGEEGQEVQQREILQFSALHAAVRLECPPEIVWHAASMNPESVTLRRGPRGRTPLHEAAAVVGRRRFHRRREKMGQQNQNPEQNQGHISVVEEDYDDDDDDDDLNEIVDMLLHSRTFGSSLPARTADADGRLPLHLAALLGMTFRRGDGGGADDADEDGVGGGGFLFGGDDDGSKDENKGPLERILKAEPRALEAKDGGGMYPFMLAAVSYEDEDDAVRKDEDDGCDVDTVYRLLRESPAVLERYCAGGSER